jgi:hypothetical protein
MSLQICRFGLLGFMLLLFSGGTLAGNFTDLYPQNILDKWRIPFKEDIEIAFYKDIYPGLSLDQQRRLGKVNLVFPDRDRCADYPKELRHQVCGGDREPFSYFAGFLGNPAQPTIVMSIQSIRFWGDLALAYAWLAATGQTAEKPSVYLSMLRYQSQKNFPGGRYPLPLQALGVPESRARADERLMETFQDIFVSGLYFLLAHELAHLVYQHPGNGDEVPRHVSRTNERQADAFAARLLAQIAQPPAGMALMMQAWSSYAPNHHDRDYARQIANMTHPIDSDRLRHLGEKMALYAEHYARRQKNPARSERHIREVASNLHLLADKMDSPDYHRLRREIGIEATLRDLRQ